jgi:hypothetical protein
MRAVMACPARRGAEPGEVLAAARRTRSRATRESWKHTWARHTTAPWEVNVLALDGVAAGYGDALAVRSISLEVAPGECVP